MSWAAHLARRQRCSLRSCSTQKCLVAGSGSGGGARHAATGPQGMCVPLYVCACMRACGCLCICLHVCFPWRAHVCVTCILYYLHMFNSWEDTVQTHCVDSALCHCCALETQASSSPCLGCVAHLTLIGLVAEALFPSCVGSGEKSRSQTTDSGFEAMPWKHSN